MTRAAPQTSNPSLTAPVAFRRDGIAGPAGVLIENTKFITFIAFYIQASRRDIIHIYKSRRSEERQHLMCCYETISPDKIEFIFM